MSSNNTDRNVGHHST